MEWRECNTGNFRRLDKRRVKKYANDMTEGRWETNGETLKRNGDVVIDGQHRIEAVILSGVTIRTAIAYDVDVTGVHIDEGAARKTSDWLRHMGMVNCTCLASCAKLILCHKLARWDWNNTSNTDIGREEVVAFCQCDYDKLQQAIRLGAKLKQHGLRTAMAIRQTTVSSVVYLGAKDNAPEESETAQWFVDKLTNGEGLGKYEPVYQLRERALTAGRSAIKRWTKDHERAMVTIAWNKTVRGEEVKQLKIAATGPTAMSIPYVLNESANGNN